MSTVRIVKITKISTGGGMVVVGWRGGVRGVEKVGIVKITKINTGGGMVVVGSEGRGDPGWPQLV